MKRLPAIAAALALGGCTVGPNFEAPRWANPVSWFSGRPKEAVVPSEPVAAPINPDWWRIFDDPKLTGLERQVASDNLDVRTAGIRIAESRAQLGITAAGQYPMVNGNASYEREKPSNNGIFGVAASKSSYRESGKWILRQQHRRGAGHTEPAIIRHLPIWLRCLVGT